MSEAISVNMQGQCYRTDKYEKMEQNIKYMSHKPEKQLLWCNVVWKKSV